MSFPRYPRYKDSGVEWLGDVPEHWATPKLKHFASFSGGGTPSRENLAYWDGDIPWVSPKDMKAERISDAEESITDAGLANSTSTLIPAGRVLMVVRSGILKHTIPVAINDVAVALNQDVKAISFAADQCGSGFFLRWVQGLNDDLILSWAKQGATVESVEHAYLAETIVPLPSLGEQHQILSFLDRETSKIDALVAEKRRLMEVLREKRQAVISDAVTKGLNPHVAMVDSEIEWLGEVPAHWDTTRLKYATELIVDCPHETPTYSEQGSHMVIRTADLEHGIIDVTRMHRLDESEYLNRIRRSALLVDDIVYGREGERWGHAALVPENDRYCLGQRMMQFRSSADFSAEFLMWHINSTSVYVQGDLDTQGATSPHVNVGTIRNYRLAQPPLDEQRKIGAFLSGLAHKFDALALETQRAIDLLVERRTAVIAAAVTGQIDVRDLSVPRANEVSQARALRSSDHIS